MRLLKILIAIVASFVLSAAALAETRVALVIGNGAYRHAPALANPKNDAEGMAASLKRLGFEVLAGTDLEKPALDKLLQAFADRLEKAEVALVFYAGHGLQVNGRNYLVPVDGKLDKESDLVFQAVALDTIQGLMEQGQRTSIMILDACRDNPLARNLARSMGTRSAGIGRGLGATQAGVGTLIVYATQPGNVALDGEGGNSPFTAALLANLESKDLEVRQVLTRVRQAVIASTKGKQVPWDSSSLTGDFFFAAAPAAREAPAPAPSPAAPIPPPSADSENLFWQSIKDSKNSADYKAYLEKYPNGTFAALAKIRLAEIEKGADVTPPAPAPEKQSPSSPPAAPRRASSFERGVYMILTSSSVPNIATAQACQAMCVADPKCGAWAYVGDKHPFDHERRKCFLDAKPGPRQPFDWGTSGVIRITSAAAPAQPGAAPANQQALIRELMRKAQAGEAEDGFCARTNWPLSVSMQTTAAILDRYSVGRAAVYRNRNACSFDRPTAIAVEGGQRCVQLATWGCHVRANKCSFANVKLCKNAEGVYVTK